MAAEMKKPASAYFLWFNATREEIQQQLGTKSFGEVGKKASEMWKSMTAADKMPWEAKAKEQKDAFEKFKGTEAGKKALDEKKAERKDAKDAKNEKNAKKAAKAVEKDDKLKKPASAYFIFSNAKRQEIQAQIGTKDMGPVAKKTTEVWKSLSDSARKPWEDQAKQQKEAYESYIKTPEGEAALKAYKDEVNEAKAGAKGKRVSGEDSPKAKRAKTAEAGA